MCLLSFIPPFSSTLLIRQRDQVCVLHVLAVLPLQQLCSVRQCQQVVSRQPAGGPVHEPRTTLREPGFPIGVVWVQSAVGTEPLALG